MLTAIDNQTPVVQHPQVIPVRRGDREIGAYVTDAQGTRFVPAVDATAVAMAALATAAAATAGVSIGLALRRHSAIGTVTMGPGGWISLRRTSRPLLRAGPAANRPWWARVLRARRLVVQH
jgi:hypothetical protein